MVNNEAKTSLKLLYSTKDSRFTFQKIRETRLFSKPPIEHAVYWFNHPLSSDVIISREAVGFYSRAVGSSENPRRRVLHNVVDVICPLFMIGLTCLPRMGEGGQLCNHPTPPGSDGPVLRLAANKSNAIIQDRYTKYLTSNLYQLFSHRSCHVPLNKIVSTISMHLVKLVLEIT